MEHNSTETDSFEGAMDDTPSTHFDILDVLSEANSQSNGTVDAPVNQTTSMYSEETETNPDEEASGPDEETVEADNSSLQEDPKDNSSSKTAKSKKKKKTYYFLRALCDRYYRYISLVKNHFNAKLTCKLESTPKR